MQITYTNKEALQNDPEVAEKNKVTADNMNEIKTVVNTNEEELSAYISDLENNQLTGQSSGTSIDLSDSADSRVRSIELEGNSEQGSTTGKNKFDGNAVTTTHPTNWTISFENDILSITHNNSYSTGSPIANLGVLPQGTYIISGIFTREIGLYRDNSYSATIRNGSTFSANGTEEIELYFSGSVESGVTDTYKKLQIELGSTATSYEPYTGGIASPNPSYPQEIHSTGDSGSVNEKVQNKNLLKLKSTLNTTRNNVEISYNEQSKKIKFTGTINSTFTYSGTMSLDEPLKPGTYVLSIDGNNRAFMYLRNSQGNVVKNVQTTNPVVTITEEVTSLNFGIEGLSNGATIDIEIGYQLEQGTTATDYTAHEEQNISIPTQQPMRAIGEYKDTFVKVDGSWYERHYIGQKIFDGTETTLSYLANYQGFRYQLEDANLVSSNPQNDLMCSHFKVSNIRGINGSPEPPIIRTYYGTTGLDAKYIFICDGNTDVNVFKTWLSNNNVELIYVLATPVDLPCTEEQTEALESLEKARTYKPVTHISSEDTVPATIDLTYVKDLETVINNLS